MTLLIDKNDPDYRAFAAAYELKMIALRDAIVRILAESDSLPGLSIYDIQDRLLRSDLPRDVKASVEGTGSIVSPTLCVQIYGLETDGRIVNVPVPGVGLFYNVGPLEKLAAQG